MNINLDMVLVILSILCVNAELKLKLLNISCCVVNFTVLKDLNFLKILRKLNQIFLKLSAKNQVFISLCGSQTCNSESLNQEILKNVISYLKATTRFDRLLIDF